MVEIWFRLFHLREKNYEVNVGSGKATTVKELVSKIKILLPELNLTLKAKLQMINFMFVQITKNSQKA